MELTLLREFPVPAGMNRLAPAESGAVYRVPRTCGDEPLYMVKTHPSKKSSPYLRG